MANFHSNTCTACVYTGIAYYVAPVYYKELAFYGSVPEAKLQRSAINKWNGSCFKADVPLVEADVSCVVCSL
jgi:hypothetical protein